LIFLLKKARFVPFPFYRFNDPLNVQQPFVKHHSSLFVKVYLNLCDPGDRRQGTLDSMDAMAAGHAFNVKSSAGHVIILFSK
jgi:hypothetical protein